ncbi:MAG: NAD-dependent epimerase/dehydratase family protein [Planctomycetes bacterium]|nr:NAD-dependent epimerase/dehydratase family protein [Planctomycetota bacterium]
MASTRIIRSGRPQAAPNSTAGGVVLVTGGGGFLGRHIVGKLLARGDRVRVVGRRPYPDLAARGVDCRQLDIADADAVKKAVEGCAAIIHTAAIPGVWGAYAMFHSANYLGSKNIVDAAVAAGIKRLVYTSTPSVVHGGHSIDGGDESLPYPDKYLNPYAATKAQAEKMILNMNSRGLATVSIRPHLIFGPGDNQLIPKLLDRARAGRLMQVGNGENLLSVSYVENVADAHLLALAALDNNPAVAGQAYFINEPEPVNCWDFINRIVVGAGLAKISRKIPYRLAYAAGWLCEKTYAALGKTEDPPMTRFLADQLATSHWFKVDKARRDLSWEPAVSLDEGVERMLASLTEMSGK